MTTEISVRECFIANIRHIAWVAAQIVLKQQYNRTMRVDQFDSLIDGIRFQDENPGMTCEQNHENWMKKKFADGWKPGPVKDVEKKEHPDLIPFKQLPWEEQVKDLVAIVAHEMADELYEKGPEFAHIEIAGKEE